MEILINSTSIGNIIITAGSVILLLVLIKLFAWEQLTGVFTAREEKIANDIDGAEAARKEAEALSSVKGDVADLTVLLAEKIMTANLDKEAQSNLIDSYLDKLGDA